MEAYVDASFGTHNLGYSHTGAVILYAGGPIFTKSCRQRVISKSSYEVELVSLSDVGSDIIHIRNFMIQQALTQGPVHVLKDNKGCDHHEQQYSFRRFESSSYSDQILLAQGAHC
jgi:hypothetical protein